MFKITKEIFANSSIHTIEHFKKGKESVLWIRIKDVEEIFDVKNNYNIVSTGLKANLKIKVLQNKTLKV